MKQQSVKMSADEFVRALRQINNMPEGNLPLHAPVLEGNERKYLMDVIDSTFVSYVGEYVGRFERMLCEKTGAGYAVACVNGTAALEIALRVGGVRPGDLVLTQALSFVATANAISHCGAEPVFCDVSAESCGLSPQSLEDWLRRNGSRGKDGPRERESGRRISACVPMHTFGLPCHISEIADICASWGIPVVEDAAEALGSTCHGKACGTFGLMGILSFNGNKICTTGGGGAILTDSSRLAEHARHLTTTAKLPHPWRFRHDEAGWNLRMPNLNAALGCAQLERLDEFVAQKRARVEAYAELFAGTAWRMLTERPFCRSNYWLAALLVENEAERDELLAVSNAAGVQTRPLWDLLHTLPMYCACPRGDLSVSEEFAARIVNLPNGFRTN